ncbi:response regulator transcription factor [soil metagenome]
MDTIRVILVDDHSVVREGLRMIIENDSEIEVGGETENMTDALRLIEREKPDVVLLDLDLGKESSLDRMQEIFKANENSRVLILTGVLDENQHKRAMQKGAQGILLKNHAGGTLLKAIKKIHQGEAWIDRTLTAKLLADANNKKNSSDAEQVRINSLTSRERDIVKLIADGLVNKEIAARLFISVKTVRNGLTVIYNKLEVANRLELAIYASHHGLG